MSPTAILGAAGAAIIGVMSLALYLLFGAYTASIEREAESRLAAAISEATLKHERELQRQIGELNDKHELERAQNEKAMGERIAEINMLRQKAERLAQVDPLGFGDDIHIRLARIMCRVEAGSDLAAVETCNSAPAETFLTDLAFTITVTAENAEIWREQCEAGNRDFCDWSITGFTPQGTMTLLAWLEAVDRYLRDLGQDDDNLRRIIEQLGKEPESEP